MSDQKKWHDETIALHGGQSPDPVTLARAVPIYRTASYVFKDSAHAARLFGLQELGNIYTRLMNPTHDVLEKRIAELEGGIAGLAIASGTSAIFYAIVNICKNGDEFVTSSNLYGGTFTMFHDILPGFGITARFSAPDADSIKKAITPKTKAIFVETIGNPSLDVTDLEAVGKVAKEAGLPLIVDSTFTTPYLVKPIEYGADVVVHSLTKWLGGHGTVIGGIVIDAGKFEWNKPKYPLFSEPDESYHGLTWGKDLGPLQPLAYILRMRTIPLRNLGACLSPDNAWQVLQGIETLPLRMDRHCDNAIKVAQHLKKHPAVSWVRYPGLEDDPSHTVAKRILRNGFGGMVVFGVRGGSEAGRKFIEKLKLFSHLANVGDAKSLAIHPSTTTHAQLTEEQQKAGGITPDMVRLSIGIEHIDDILEDLDQALLD